MVFFHHVMEDMEEFIVAKTGSHDVGPATKEKELMLKGPILFKFCQLSAIFR